MPVSATYSAGDTEPLCLKLRETMTREQHAGIGKARIFKCTKETTKLELKELTSNIIAA